MNEYFVATIQPFIYECQSRINDFFGDVVRVIYIHKIKNEAIRTPRNQVLRVIFGRATAAVTKFLPVIRLFTGMNNTPAILPLHCEFIITFVAYK